MVMNQELTAGIVFCLLGLSLLFLSPDKLWMVTEKWKTKDGGQPSKSYTVVMRMLGIVFSLAGGLLIKLAVK